MLAALAQRTAESVGTGHRHAAARHAAGESAALAGTYQYTGRGQRRCLSGRLPRRRTARRLALARNDRDTVLCATIETLL